MECCFKVVKLESVNNELVCTPVGYIGEESKSSFESIHGCPFTDWANTHGGDCALVDYFDTNDPCYLLDTSLSHPSGLSLITNLENPEA